MRTVVLSRNAEAYSTRRLAEAARAAGLEGGVLDPFRFRLAGGPGPAAILYEGRPAPAFDGMIPRIGAGTNASGLTVIRHLEMRGVVPLNRHDAILGCRDKFRTIQTLGIAGLPVPPTALTLRQEDVQPAVRDLGGPPVVLKVLEAGQGSGVFLAHTAGEAEDRVRSLHAAGRYVLIQGFLEGSGRTDLRAFVVGDEVVAAMRRRAAPGEFRSNVHLGGTAEKADLPPPLAGLAVRAARAVHLDVAGVDLLETEAGPVVLEVNASPGLESIERTSGADIAGRMVARLAELLAAAPRDG